MDHPVASLRDIAGIEVTELRQITDARGAVLHMLRSDSPGFSAFGECYFSEVAPGAIKAWKRHKRQTQNLAVPVGRIRLVIVDERGPEKRFVSGDLGRPDAYVRVRIPPGVWYGFANIGNAAALLANCADMPHDPEEGETRPVDDSGFEYRWDIPSSR